jgi:hypothetical protein
MGEQQAAVVAPVAVDVEPEEDDVPATPPTAIAIPEAFKPVNGHTKAVVKRRQGGEAQLRLF